MNEGDCAKVIQQFQLRQYAIHVEFKLEPGSKTARWRTASSWNWF